MNKRLYPISIEDKLNAILDDLHEVKLRLSALEQRLASQPKPQPTNTPPEKDCDFGYPKYHD